MSLATSLLSQYVLGYQAKLPISCQQLQHFCGRWMCASFEPAYKVCTNIARLIVAYQLKVLSQVLIIESA
jgi:hypothetical protein